MSTSMECLFKFHFRILYIRIPKSILENTHRASSIANKERKEIKKLTIGLLKLFRSQKIIRNDIKIDITAVRFVCLVLLDCLL